MILKLEKEENLLQEAEYKLIDSCLEISEGNRTRAAEMLGINVRTLRNKLQQYPEIADKFHIKGNQIYLNDKLLLFLFQKKNYNLTSLAEYFNITTVTIASRLKNILGARKYKRQLDRNRFLIRKRKNKKTIQ